MVVPAHVALAADQGDLAQVETWLNSAGPDAVNDVCDQGYTCLLQAVIQGNPSREHVELTRFLIARGADVNLCCPEGWAPLHYATYHARFLAEGSRAVAMVSLLLQAGARVNARTCSSGEPSYGTMRDTTPLGILLGLNYSTVDMDWSSFRGCMVALLRAGALLDRISSDGRSAEEIMREYHDYVRDDENYIKAQKLVAGVREHGSYKRYLCAPHREFIRFRSLLVRGRAKTNGLNERIARLPNGACWKVLSYWREDN